MPKYRKLPVTVLDSLDITDMPDDFTRLTWLLLPLVVCRNGRAFDIPQWLVSKLYPARTDVDAGMVAQAMEWFESRSMIGRYEVDGRRYFYLTNWAKHQGDTSREAESPYPEPPTHDQLQTDEIVADGLEPELLATNSRVGHEQVASNSRSMQGNENTRARAREMRARDAAPAKPPPGKSPPSPSKKQLTPEKQAFADMVNALGDVCGMSPRMNWDKLSSVAEQLIESGYTADQVLRHFSTPHGWWYAHDWRGQKGDIPEPKHVVEKIYGAVKSDAPTHEPEGGKLWLDHAKVFN